MSAAAAEQLAAREQLCMYFKSDYGFKFHIGIIEQRKQVSFFFHQFDRKSERETAFLNARVPLKSCVQTAKY